MVGYKPYSYQRAVHSLLNNAKGSDKIIVVKARRQCGKSIMVENELLRYSIAYTRQKNAVVSPTLKQSKKMFKELIDAVASSGIISSANGSDLEIKFVTGSMIRFFSAEQGGEALRGYTVTGLLCIDEAEFIPAEIFYTVLPWRDYFKAPVLITSTPRLKTGWFYDYYMRGMAGTENIVSIDWCEEQYQADLNRILTPAKLEEYKRILPRAIYITEYLGEFVDDGGGVFNVGEWYDFKQAYNELYFGIDWANNNGGDKTAVVAFNERGEQVIIEYWNDISDPIEQVKKIAGILRQHKGKVKKVLAEKNSIGDTFLKLLQKEIRVDGIEAVGFDTSNESKRGIIESLTAAIGDGTVKLKDEKENKLEFNAYQAEVTRSGKITYNGSFGFNDDIVVATAIANKARISNYGSYNIRFSNNWSTRHR